VSIFRIREAADLLGVSDDTVRQWADSGRVAVTTDHAGRQGIEGAVLARLAEDLAASTERPEPQPVVSESARNRFVGLVTRVLRDTVMAQVEIQAGPHRIERLVATYAELPADGVGALFGSTDHLEIAASSSSAACGEVRSATAAHMIHRLKNGTPTAASM
jgi:excisionase family DNA binding protein